jgi:hypothetical protein
MSSAMCSPIGLTLNLAGASPADALRQRFAGQLAQLTAMGFPEDQWCARL